ncbi:hypothetical protein SprV_0200781500 [Sparganum proliferum]
MQRSVDLFTSGCTHFKLTVNTDKTVVMHQHPSKAEYSIPRIRVNGTKLKPVNNFNYLGSTMRRCDRINDELAHRISKASQASGQLQNSL